MNPIDTIETAFSPEVIALLVFLFAICIGSFLNVVIHRLPLGEDLFFERSHCPRCFNRVAWYDNVPLVSWLALRARCRHCATPISWRYPGVEALTGFAGVGLYLQYGLTPAFGIYCVFLAILIALTFIDLDHYILPDSLNYGGLAIGLAASIWVFDRSWTEIGFGVLGASGVLLCVYLAYLLITKREGMGLGDIKMMAMIGAFIGPEGALFTLMSSSVIGMFAGLALMLFKGRGRKHPMPFGPSIAGGAALYVYAHQPIIEGLNRLMEWITGQPY